MFWHIHLSETVKFIVHIGWEVHVCALLVLLAQMCSVAELCIYMTATASPPMLLLCLLVTAYCIFHI